MFLASKTYEKQLSIEKTRLSHQVWSHGGSTFKKKRILNGHFSRPAETDPYVFFCVSKGGKDLRGFLCFPRDDTQDSCARVKGLRDMIVAGLREKVKALQP